MSNIILGIDPGIGRTGFALLEKDKDDTIRLIEYGCFTTSSNKPSYQRLLTLYNNLKKIIKKYKPNILAIEKLFFNTNAKTATLVGQAMGTIMLAGAKADIKIYELTPLQVKIALTGYGRAQKSQVQKMVMRLLNLKKKPTPDDAADAIAVALSCIVTNFKLTPTAETASSCEQSFI